MTMFFLDVCVKINKFSTRSKLSSILVPDVHGCLIDIFCLLMRIWL